MLKLIDGGKFKIPCCLPYCYLPEPTVIHAIWLLAYGLKGLINYDKALENVALHT